MPTPNSIIGKKPLPLSLLEKYARIKRTALTPNGAIILVAFIFNHSSLLTLWSIININRTTDYYYNQLMTLIWQTNMSSIYGKPLLLEG